MDQAELVARLAEELRAAEDRGDMLAEHIRSETHVLQTPISGVMGYGEWLVEQLGAPEPDAAEVAEDIRQIVHLAGHAGRGLTRLFSIVRPPGRRPSDRCDLAAVVADAWSPADRPGPGPRLRIVHAPVPVAVGSSRVAEILDALVLMAAGPGGATGGLDLEVRVVPAPGTGREADSHARLRVLGAARPGRPVEWRVMGRGVWAPDLERLMADDGIVMGGVRDGRQVLDWWLPLAT